MGKTVRFADVTVAKNEEAVTSYFNESAIPLDYFNDVRLTVHAGDEEAVCTSYLSARATSEERRALDGGRFTLRLWSRRDPFGGVSSGSVQGYGRDWTPSLRPKGYFNYDTGSRPAIGEVTLRGL